MSDSDKILKLVGVALIAFIVIAVLTGILAAMNPDIGTLGPGETDWSGDRINETHFQITYEEGPAIPSDELVVSVDGYDRHGAWSGRVVPGDSGAVRVAPDSVVRLYWLSESGPRDRLAEWTL